MMGHKVIADKKLALLEQAHQVYNTIKPSVIEQ